MAKGNKKNDEVQLVSEGLEKKLTSNLKNTPKKEEPIIVVEDKKEEEDLVVVVEQPKEVVAPVKMVKVLMSENHKCCIGGEWYYLMKGKQYNVPLNVKEVLMRANKLSPM